MSLPIFLWENYYNMFMFCIGFFLEILKSLKIALDTLFLTDQMHIKTELQQFPNYFLILLPH